MPEVIKLKSRSQTVPNEPTVQAALDVLSASAGAAVAINRLVDSFVAIDRMYADSPPSDCLRIIIQSDRKRMLAAIAEMLVATSDYTKDVQAEIHVALKSSCPAR